jgi:hypothetical protein
MICSKLTEDSKYSFNIALTESDIVQLRYICKAHLKRYDTEECLFGLCYELLEATSKFCNKDIPC